MPSGIILSWSTKWLQREGGTSPHPFRRLFVRQYTMNINELDSFILYRIRRPDYGCTFALWWFSQHWIHTHYATPPGDINKQLPVIPRPLAPHLWVEMLSLTGFRHKHRQPTLSPQNIYFIWPTSASTCIRWWGLHAETDVLYVTKPTM